MPSTAVVFSSPDCFYSSAPSTSESAERKAPVVSAGRVRKPSSEVLRRRALIRMAARRVKWAKRNVAMREVRMQIDREFEAMEAENKKVLDRLNEDNKALKAATKDAFSKCASLLSTVQSLTSALSHSAPRRCDWAAVPRSGSESPDFSEEFYEPLFFSPSFHKPHLSKC